MMQIQGRPFLLTPADELHARRDRPAGECRGLVAAAPYQEDAGLIL